MKGKPSEKKPTTAFGLTKQRDQSFKRSKGVKISSESGPPAVQEEETQKMSQKIEEMKQGLRLNDWLQQKRAPSSRMKRDLKEANKAKEKETTLSEKYTEKEEKEEQEEKKNAETQFKEEETSGVAPKSHSFCCWQCLKRITSDRLALSSDLIFCGLPCMEKYKQENHVPPLPAILFQKINRSLVSNVKEKSQKNCQFSSWVFGFVRLLVCLQSKKLFFF